MPFLIILIICIASGLQTNDGYTLLISILVSIAIGTVIQICWIDAKYKENQKSIKRHKQTKTKKQDNFGIIEYRNK